MKQIETKAYKIKQKQMRQNKSKWNNIQANVTIERQIKLNKNIWNKIKTNRTK